MHKNTIVGLFGTCGNDKWREPFMADYKKSKIDFYNPDVGDDWTPDMVTTENEHLQNDDIILFPVLGSTLGTGSLAEIGFSVQNVYNSILNGSPQYLVVLIDDKCDGAEFTKEEIKNSNNSRALIKSKVRDLMHPNIFLVDTLDELLDISKRLVSIIETANNLQEKYGQKNKVRYQK